MLNITNTTNTLPGLSHQGTNSDKKTSWAAQKKLTNIQSTMFKKSFWCEGNKHWKAQIFQIEEHHFEKSRTWSLTSAEWEEPSRNRGNSSRGIDLANCAIVRLSADGDDGHWNTWHIIWKLTLCSSMMMVMWTMRKGTNILGDCDKGMFFQSSLLYGLDDFTSIIWIVYCRSSIDLKDKVVEFWSNGSL